MERRLQLILARRTLMLRGVHKFLRLSPKVLQVELTLTYTDAERIYVLTCYAPCTILPNKGQVSKYELNFLTSTACCKYCAI
jgi:hypothetical protein